jgi:fumarate hydratase class II
LAASPQFIRTIDSFPSERHIAVAVNTKQRLIPAVTALRDAIVAEAAVWDDIVMIGRTHMQEATPHTLGQEWSGYACMLSDDLEPSARRRSRFPMRRCSFSITRTERNVRVRQSCS